MTTPQLGPYRYWGDQKPDQSKPLLTFTRPRDAASAPVADGEASAAPASVATLRIYGPIDSWGGWWGVSAKDVARALDELGAVDELVVRVNSPGGDSFEGRAIMNLLRAHSAHTVAAVDGLAASAASYVAVGCDETVMAPGTELMIHDTHALVYADEAGLRKAADIVGSISRSGSELYADIAGGTPEEWRALQAAETWFTAAEAVTAGLADRVGIVPDSGPVETAADDDAEVLPAEGADERSDATFDLSIFTFAGREQAPAPKPPSASAVGSITTQGTESAVAFSDEQMKTMRQELGLSEDADEATIVAALSKASKPEETTSPTTKVPEGMALVEKDVLDGLRAQASEGAAARQQQLTEHRDRTIAQAIKDGKITPARREAWEKKWAADAEGAEQDLASLEAGLVPVAEKGHAAALESDDTLEINDADLDAFAAGLGLTKEALRG